MKNSIFLDTTLNSPAGVVAGSYTSIETLRVVWGDEKGSLESETVKYGPGVPRDSELKITALARVRSNWLLHTRPHVRESALHQQTHNCLTVIKIWL
jgi:hypothetical protein